MADAVGSAGAPLVDVVEDVRRLAAASGLPVIDLGVGSPIDPTPAVVREALSAAADAHGYPRTAGSDALVDAIRGWASHRVGAILAADEVLPTIGSKELVGLLPSLLGLRDVRIVMPPLAYPTYAVGARFAGLEIVETDEPESVSGAGLVWLCSPRNPTGQVLGAERLAELVEWARQSGVLLVNDECYLDFGWDVTPRSVLDPEINGGHVDGIVAVHSLSKRSNMAGYRVGFVAGDRGVVGRLLERRKHLGLIVPAPVQAAAVAALEDEEHVAEQRQRYQRRREILRSALESAGFRIDHSEAGLYLWVTRDEAGSETVRWFAERGILVAPGAVYGPEGHRHVRLALTSPDLDIATAAERLRG